MAEQKIQPSNDDVMAYLQSIEDEKKRADALAICALMEEVTGEPAVMWGSMIGFGRYYYKYESGHEG